MYNKFFVLITIPCNLRTMHLSCPASAGDASIEADEICPVSSFPQGETGQISSGLDCRDDPARICSSILYTICFEKNIAQVYRRMKSDTT